MPRIFGLAATLIAVLSVPGGTVRAQALSAAERAPRFYLASANSRTLKLKDATDVPILRRRISAAFDRLPLEDALDVVSTKARLRLVYARDVLPAGARASLTATNITVTAALTEILLDTGLDVIISPTGQMTLVRRHAAGPTGSIVGRLSDAKTGMSLAGADVALEGTRWRATTDTGGRYQLTGIDTGTYTLVARRIGYAKLSRNVTVRDGQADTVNAALDAVVTRLDEVITTATGRQRRLAVPNDITVLNADSIVQTQPVTSITDLLDGRVPGLTVQHTSGAPGAPSRLRLRGPGSPLGNNDPVVFVDGIRVYAEQSAARSANLAANGYAAPSPLDYIDVNSIETIEVVKGPSAATLYGQDAANGVIVITTKKGKAGPARWTTSLEHARTAMIGRYPDLIARWGHLVSDVNAFVLCPIRNEAYAGGSTAACEADSTGTFQILNDPALTVLGGGYHTGASLGASGGTAALTYYITGSYQGDVGLPRLSDYEATRYQATHGGQPAVDWMRRPQSFRTWSATATTAAQLSHQAQLSLSTSIEHQMQQQSDLQGQLGTLMSTYLDTASGKYYVLGGSTRAYTLNSSNDLPLSYYTRVTDATTTFDGGANFEWRAQEWLSLSAKAGLNFIQRVDELYLPRAQSPADSTGRFNSGHGTSLVSTIGARANATVPLGLGFLFGFATGFDYTGTQIEDVQIATNDLALGTEAPGNQLISLVQTSQNDATFGFYAEPGITHRKISFTTGLRFDGGKNYGRGVTLPSFPKLGFSYLLSDERFYPLRNLVPTLRLRASYGRSSRQPGISDHLRLYQAPVQEFVDGQTQTLTTLKTLGNTQLRPERTTEIEGGFDAGSAGDRLVLTITGYRKTTDDALLSVPIAPSVYGTTTIMKNIGTIRNTGLEATLNANLLRRASISWVANLGVTWNRNVVVSLGPGVLPFYQDYGTSSDGSGLRLVPGYPLFGRWAKPVLGYADANGNGILETGEVQFGDTAVYVGQTLPNYQANFSSSFTFWGGALAVTADFGYDNGLSQLNTVGRQLAPFSKGQSDVNASLTEQLSTVPMPNEYYTDYNWIQTVSTKRFRAMTVTYNMPGALARRFGAQALSLSLQGDNLGVWTSYRGLDPNVNSAATGNNVLDAGVLPRPRKWQIRVHATY